MLLADIGSDGGWCYLFGEDILHVVERCKRERKRTKEVSIYWFIGLWIIESGETKESPSSYLYPIKRVMPRRGSFQHAHVVVVFFIIISHPMTILRG